MPAISPARAANVATHAWTKIYTEIMTLISWVFLHGLLSSVEAQTSAMHASTSVVFGLSPRCCTLTVSLHWPHTLHGYQSL